MTCLVNTGAQTSINPAVRRRDSLLAARTTSSATGTAQLKESGGPEPSTVSSPVEDVVAVKQNLSASQQIAQNVLSGQTEPVQSSNYNNFSFGKSSGSLEGTTPIQVAIVERKSYSSLFLGLSTQLDCTQEKVLGFLVLYALYSWSGSVLSVSFIIFSFVLSLTNTRYKVFLVILSVFFENTGFMKAGPRQSEFEPTEGKTVKFSDVHGVDEAKDVPFFVVSYHLIHS